MAGQLRAAAALGSGLTSKQYSYKSPTFLACWSSHTPPSPITLLCRNACSRGGSNIVASNLAQESQSSFWGAATIEQRICSTTHVERDERKGKGGVARAGGPAGTAIRKSPSGGVVPTKPLQFLLIGVATAYMTLIVIIPFLNVFYQAFSFGVQPFIHNLLDPAFQSAVRMTLTVAGIVVPMNTLFGLIISLWVTRNDFPGKALLLSFIDLPFSISPVVVGLMLMLLYGRQGVFAPFLRRWNIEIVFALPGMLLATCFVTLPYVVREVIPVLMEMDIFEEEAARTMGANDWEVFWQVTLPNIRLGLLYGITLCNARAMGEFGAVSVISGNIVGQTQTLTLFVEAAYKEYNTQGAFSAALLLSVFALITLVVKSKLEEERMKQISVR